MELTSQKNASPQYGITGSGLITTFLEKKNLFFLLNDDAGV